MIRTFARPSLVALGSWLTALVLFAAAAGCDCGGGLAGTRCATSSDCTRGSMCIDGRCTAPAADAGGDAPFDPSAVVSFRIEPATASLEIVDGSMPEQRFEAIATTAGGSERIIARPAWFLGGSLGSVTADGTFHSDGVSAGEETLTATLSEGGETHTAMATVRVTARWTIRDPSLPTDIETTFDGAAPGTEGPANIVYPLEGAVMPDNVYPPTVQWDPVGAEGDVFRVRVTKPSVTITAYVPLGAGFGHGLLVPRTAWRSIAESEDDATVSITVDRLSTAAGTVTPGAAPRTMRLARGSIYGRVYYWVLNRGRTETLDPITATTTVTVPSPPPSVDGSGSRCVACHSVSNEGRWLFGVRGGDSFDVGFDLTTSLAADPAPTRWAPSSALLTMGSFDPTSRYVVGVAGWSGPMRVLDADTGAEAPSTGLPTAGASFPAWSHDGARVTYSGDVALAGDGHPISGNVYVLPRTGATGLDFGAPTLVHDGSSLGTAPEGGTCDSHPVWPPDDAFVVFQHGPRTFSFVPGSAEVPAGALYRMAADGSGLVRLDAANGGATGTSAYWPSFAPYITAEADGHEYYWVAFYSRRDYGNELAGTRGRNLRQLWIAAIDGDAPPGSDPSFVPYWLPGQDRDVNNISAYWAPEPCRVTGAACGTSGECCSERCDLGPDDMPICMPPPPGECRDVGETCGGDADCCSGRCVGNVCFDELM